MKGRQITAMKALTFWDPAPLPTAIFFDDGTPDGQTLVGPFCKNCGWREGNHIKPSVAAKKKGNIVWCCPPPTGMNPMDPRPPYATTLAMGLRPKPGMSEARDRRWVRRFASTP